MKEINFYELLLLALFYL